MASLLFRSMPMRGRRPSYEGDRNTRRRVAKNDSNRVFMSCGSGPPEKLTITSSFGLWSLHHMAGTGHGSPRGRANMRDLCTAFACKETWNSVPRARKAVKAGSSSHHYPSPSHHPRHLPHPPSASGSPRNAPRPLSATTRHSTPTPSQSPRRPPRSRPRGCSS